MRRNHKEEFKQLVLEYCEEAEKQGRSFLTDSDIFDIEVECRRRGIRRYKEFMGKLLKRVEEDEEV